jgi:hypothetical protein
MKAAATTPVGRAVAEYRALMPELAATPLGRIEELAVRLELMKQVAAGHQLAMADLRHGIYLADQGKSGRRGGPRAADPARPTVYFLRYGEEGPIKIGYSQNLGLRLSSYRTHTHLTVNVLHRMDGTKKDEKRIQAYFSDLHLKGEWFEAAPRLLDFIDQLRTGAGL